MIFLFPRWDMLINPLEGTFFPFCAFFWYNIRKAGKTSMTWLSGCGFFPAVKRQDFVELCTESPEMPRPFRLFWCWAHRAQGHIEVLCTNIQIYVNKSIKIVLVYRYSIDIRFVFKNARITHMCL